MLNNRSQALATKQNFMADHTKNSSNFVNSFFPYKNKSESEAVGLALIDSLIDEKLDENFSKPINIVTVFGSNLKVQIPNITDHQQPSSISPAKSPNSPADFGIKTKNSQFLSPFSKNLEKNFTRQLSLKEMELSEDYTRVITHGPNPKTTHIFDDCIVDCEFGADVSKSPSENFKSFCHTCKKSIGGKEICLYRGEKDLISHDCCCQEMLFEGMNNP